VPGFTSGYVKIHVVPYVPKMASAINNTCTVYPNPANTVLNISTSNEIQTIEIISMAGVKLLATGENTSFIDISTLSYGMYQVICIFKNGSRVVSSFTKL